MNALAIMGGGSTNAGVTKIVITDMVMMEFDSKYKITNATIYDKTKNTAIATNIYDGGCGQFEFRRLLQRLGAELRVPWADVQCDPV